jgi:predicted RNA-binding Zn ribbon-like protein
MLEADDFIAGAPSLDFVNTVGGIRKGKHDDKLESYADLIEWAVLGGALSKAHAEILAKAAHAQQDAALQVLRRAKRLREALHAVFAALSNSRVPPNAALNTVNAEIGSALGHARLKPEKGHLVWDWDTPATLAAPLWPIARDAGELLTSGKLDRLAECASKTCGWLFLDLSKNHSRRWCNMKGCGNRDKVRRYREHISHQ